MSSVPDGVIYVAQAGSLLWTFIWSICRISLYIPYSLTIIACRSIFSHLHTSHSSNSDDANRGTSFYKGFVMHSRKRPKENTFTYPVRMPLIDLDKPPHWWTPGDGDTLTAGEARSIAATSGRVRLLTHPPAAGYVQNPISVYYCYSNDNKNVEKCLAEVTNTPWGERVTFSFSPTPTEASTGQAIPKALHVSPLMDMKSTWVIKAPEPTENRLFLSVSATKHPQYGDYFYAVLDAKIDDPLIRHLPNEIASLKTLLQHGFQPQRVAFWIYWQAVVLLWKGIKFYAPPEGKGYRERAIAKSTHSKTGDGDWFIWRDALRWPWKSSS